jgi:proline iminopeptidase
MKTITLIFKVLLYLLGAALLVFCLLLVIPERETVPPIQPRESTQYWAMKQGFELAYTHLPNQDSMAKTPVIFLHGGPGGYVHSSMITTLEGLTKHGHDVYLYDQRGSGLSDRMPKFSDVSFEYHLQDLHEIITEKIKTPQVIFIGQSFGSIIAAHYSVRYPQQVAKVVFLFSGNTAPPSEGR